MTSGSGVELTTRSLLVRLPATTLSGIGKLFTPICLRRSQWSSGNVHDCGVTGSHRYDNHGNIQPWAWAANPTTVSRSTQLSTIPETVK